MDSQPDFTDDNEYSDNEKKDSDQTEEENCTEERLTPLKTGVYRVHLPLRDIIPREDSYVLWVQVEVCFATPL